jgi:predicted Mrr-cat superfamily restriction endonuclease
MKPEDWVVVPNKGKATVNVGEITGGYTFDPTADDSYFHFHTVSDQD